MWTDWFQLSFDETALNIDVGRENEITPAFDDGCLDAEVEFVHLWHVSKKSITQLHTIDVIRVQSNDGEKQREFFKIDHTSKQWNN